ncbi:hypothetical protein LCGC14_2828490 [marine sediment metagenome]|uniref:Uncharacterized protein n=1 Tax=marine sediment metagenome TaxID=412755 RepID=A0A0F8Z1M0_9ZZZZ
MKIENINKMSKDDLLKLCVFVTEYNNLLFSKLGQGRIRIISYISTGKDKFPKIKIMPYLKRVILRKYERINNCIEDLKKMEFDLYSLLLEKDSSFIMKVPKEYLGDIFQLEERVRIKKLLGRR